MSQQQDRVAFYKDAPINDTTERSCCQKIVNRNSFDKIESLNTHDMIKILVVGPGDSGKSTILKQMRLIHDRNYSTDERKKFKYFIVLNLLDSTQRLVQAMRSLFKLSFKNEENESNYRQLIELKESSTLNSSWELSGVNYGKMISAIWRDESIQITYSKRTMFYLSDSTHYFMTNIDRISHTGYIPDTEDVLRVRQPTTSIIEHKFKIYDSYFLFVDVGGQRSERRKWLSCFENVTSLLFVASLSDYDLKMSPDEVRLTSGGGQDVNRMREAIELFRTLVNWKKKNYVNRVVKRTNSKQYLNDVAVQESLLFENVSIILFLNKEDLFNVKYEHSSPKKCFTDFNPAYTVDQAKEFIARKFIECCSSTRVDPTDDPSLQRAIYWHYTYALDRQNIETVFASVKDRIIKHMFDNIRL